MSREIKPGRKTAARSVISVLLNILITVFAVVGICVMVTEQSSGTGLTSKGIENLKYFTVLSNLFCGATAVVWLICRMTGKRFSDGVKLMAASSVGLTFLIVAAFLAPMYPDLDLYAGGNLWFHLILPLTGMAEYILLETEEKPPFRQTFRAVIPPVVYGCGYLANILINGVGEWPDSNDWYGFLNWGYPVGIVIFAVTALLSFGIAALLRGLNILANRTLPGTKERER